MTILSNCHEISIDSAETVRITVYASPMYRFKPGTLLDIKPVPGHGGLNRYCTTLSSTDAVTTDGTVSMLLHNYQPWAVSIPRGSPVATATLNAGSAAECRGCWVQPAAYQGHRGPEQSSFRPLRGPGGTVDSEDEEDDSEDDEENKDSREKNGQRPAK